MAKLSRSWNAAPLILCLILDGIPVGAQERAAALYERYCASCHDPEHAGSTPDTRTLRRMSPDVILRSMTSGTMASRAAALSRQEKELVAEWLAGRGLSRARPTLRVDYTHTGSASEERFELEGLIREGPWPGAPSRRADTTGFGKYFFEVRDRAGGELLYSRGFASIFGEWELTAEARQNSATFHESLRFPEPEAAFRIVLRKRDRRNEWRIVWEVDLDPAEGVVDHTAPPEVEMWEVMRNGEPERKADILLLGDGYTAAEMDKWRRDARRMAAILFAESPFRERRGDFNVRALATPAEESGIARPSDSVHRRSPLRLTYDALGSERYILTFDNRRLRDIAATAPYDFLIIVANDRKYGGGGIFNLYATVAADNAFTPYVLVHEFGHHFAGLADEYYTSEVAYEAPAALMEPWEPNVTTDFRAPKWKDLLSPGAPLPTPWPKEAFEELQKEIQARRRALREQHRPEEEMEALFREEVRKTTALLAGAPYAGQVGAFEGAMYQARGLYRPRMDCIMFSRNPVGFCAACRRAIERVIDLYAPGG